jgi:hypothetical protein
MNENKITGLLICNHGTRFDCGLFKMLVQNSSYRAVKRRKTMKYEEQQNKELIPLNFRSKSIALLHITRQLIVCLVRPEIHNVKVSHLNNIITPSTRVSDTCTFQHPQVSNCTYNSTSTAQWLNYHHATKVISELYEHNRINWLPYSWRDYYQHMRPYLLYLSSWNINFMTSFPN